MIKHNPCDDVFVSEYLLVCKAMIYVFVHNDVMIKLMLLIMLPICECMTFDEFISDACIMQL